MISVHCATTPTYNSNGTVRCTDWIEIIEPATLAETFEQLAITPENIIYVYSWGAGAILSMWALGFVVGVAKSVINKA